MAKTDLQVPEIATELYKLMEKGDNLNINNATTIKCLMETEESRSNENSQILLFNLDSLSDLEDMEIIDAELHIYRTPNETDQSIRFSLDHIIRLYQVVEFNGTEDNSTEADENRLLSVIFTSSTYKGWQVFK